MEQAAGFSGALKIMDLDDFLAPAQDCIIPMKASRSKASSCLPGRPGRSHTRARSLVHRLAPMFNVVTRGDAQRAAEAEAGSKAAAVTISMDLESDAGAALDVFQLPRAAPLATKAAPLPRKRPQRAKGTRRGRGVAIDIGLEIDALDGGAAAAGKIEALDAIKVSLSDCLACSGCLTSAQTVLVNHQVRAFALAAAAAARMPRGAALGH